MASRDIQIPLPGGGLLPAYHAPPRTADTAPGIVLLQEIFGVNTTMRAVADDYAARGFHAIVPDLFWRQEPGVRLDPASAADRERAMALMQGLDQALAVEDALAAAAYLRSAGASTQVGAVGYCLGGKLAYLLAMQPGIAAAVSYYGVAIQSALDRADDLRAPLLLHIAGDDHLCPPAAQAAIRHALESRPDVRITLHPGVGHAFARRGSEAFDRTAAGRADQETATFLAAALGVAA